MGPNGSNEDLDVTTDSTAAASATPPSPSTSGPSTSPSAPPAGTGDAGAGSSIVDAGKDLKAVGDALKGKIDDVWAGLQKQGPQLVAGLKAAADQAYVTFKGSLQDAKLSDEEEADVRRAFHKFAYIGVNAPRAITDPTIAADLDQKRKDAVALLAGVTAVKVHDAERAVLTFVTSLFAFAQDFILQGAEKALDQLFAHAVVA